MVCSSISEKRSLSILKIARSDSRSCAIVDRRNDFINLSLEKFRSLLATRTGKVNKIEYALTKSGKQLHKSSFIKIFKISFRLFAFKMNALAHALNANICRMKSAEMSLS